MQEGLGPRIWLSCYCVVQTRSLDLKVCCSLPNKGIKRGVFRRTGQRMIKCDDYDKVALQADKSFRVRVSSSSQN